MAYYPGPSPTGQANRYDSANTSHDRSGTARSTSTIGHDALNRDNDREASPGSSRSNSVGTTDLWATGVPDTSGSPSLQDKPRVRISKACTPCRKVKLRCNGGQPCGRCQALSLPIDECTYPPSLRGKTRRKKVEIEAERRASQANGSSQPNSARHSNKVTSSGTGTFADRNNHDRSRVSRGQEATRWDEGWTMRQMKEDFAKWKHDEELVNTGPRNANLWHNPVEARSTIPAKSRYNAPHASSNTNTGSRHYIPGLDTDTIPDRYTTLPFPGDSHNPLGVLAEASASADNAGPNDIPSPSPFQPTGGPGSRPASEDGTQADGQSHGYYIPLERVLKNDAPHIMALISVHE